MWSAIRSFFSNHPYAAAAATTLAMAGQVPLALLVVAALAAGTPADAGAPMGEGVVTTAGPSFPPPAPNDAATPPVVAPPAPDADLQSVRDSIMGLRDVAQAELRARGIDPATIETEVTEPIPGAGSSRPRTAAERDAAVRESIDGLVSAYEGLARSRGMTGALSGE